MKSVLALLVTAVALAVGFFFLGYGYSEWWEAKPLARVEGWMVHATDEVPIAGGARGQVFRKEEVVHEVAPGSAEEAALVSKAGVRELTELPPDWPRVGSIRFDYYCYDRLPGRARDMTQWNLYDIDWSQPAGWIGYNLCVQPGVDTSQGLYAISKSARYVIDAPGLWGEQRSVHEFQAPDGREAMTLATDLAWHFSRSQRESLVRMSREVRRQR